MPVIQPTQQLLLDARNAYHRLMTGTSARELVDQNGERVTFTAINKADLYAYIAQMEQAFNPVQVGMVAPNAPAGFLF